MILSMFQPPLCIWQHFTHVMVFVLHFTEYALLTFSLSKQFYLQATNVLTCLQISLYQHFWRRHGQLSNLTVTIQQWLEGWEFVDKYYLSSTLCSSDLYLYSLCLYSYNKKHIYQMVGSETILASTLIFD